MSTFLLLMVTGVGLGAMYFLVASGLSLIYGLMDVLNFAHGAFLTVGAYAVWVMATSSAASRLAAVSHRRRGGDRVTSVFSALVELFLIRPLYGRHIEQVLVTVGLALAIALSSPRSGGTTRASSPPRSGWARPPRCRCAHPERPSGSRSAPRCSCCSG